MQNSHTFYLWAYISFTRVTLQRKSSGASLPQSDVLNFFGHMRNICLIPNIFFFFTSISMIYRGTLVSSYKVSSLFSVFIKLNTSSFLFLFCSRGWKERTIGGWAHNPGGTPEWVGVWEVRALIPTVSEEVRRLTLEGGSQRSLFAFIGDHAQETYELWSDVTLAVMTKGRLVDFFFFCGLISESQWTYEFVAGWNDRIWLRDT